MQTDPIVLFLVDGMRPDALEQAHTPTMQALMRAGSHTLTARTCYPSITLPCIQSIFHSVTPETHATITNTWDSASWTEPGLFDLFHHAGKKTAFFYNWEQLRDVSRPGSLDFSLCLNTSESKDLAVGESDRQLTSLALPIFSKLSSDLTCIYLGCVDTAGHQFGWMSPEYLNALEIADACIEQMIKSFPENSRLIITSDHGGHDFHHGSHADQDMTIPVILYGPEIPAAVLPEPVSSLDIAPTIAALGGLSAPEKWAGRSLI